MAEKDRFGDKLRDAEKGREDQYFAQKDREMIDKLREETDSGQIAELQAQVGGRCPRDGGVLQPRKLHGVAIEECPNCNGMWLDAGEWKVLADRERGGFFGRWFLGDRDA